MIAHSIWTSADYAPMAERLDPAGDEVLAALGLDRGEVLDIGAGHGNLTCRLLESGLGVTALEPVAAMAAVGRARCPEARWVRGYAETLPFPDAHFDAIASSFGAFIATEESVGDEWARVLKPGGRLVMTAWDRRGFFAEETLRMEACFRDVPVQPPHMRWADPGVAEARLGRRFDQLSIEQHELAWGFPSVEAGMEFYRHGSPTHAFAFERSGGKRREILQQTLKEHLEENADNNGVISSYAGYVVITARINA